MADKTGIEWTDATWNPMVGCSKVSPGCANCYAEGVARRFADHGYASPFKPWTPANAAHNVILKPDRLAVPLRWQRPRLVFVNSMSDLFHEQVPDEFIDRVFAVMALASKHTFQVLTKRPDRMRDYLLERTDPTGVLPIREASAEFLSIAGNPTAPWSLPLPNVWLGTSVENNRHAFRADELRATPAAVRFISAEPLLGPLDELDLTDLHWIIAGGESGPGSRPMHPDWPRGLRDRCAEAGVAFHFKQWGSWVYPDQLPEDVWVDLERRLDDPSRLHRPDPFRMSKKLAGRLLDERTHDGMPEVHRVA